MWAGAIAVLILLVLVFYSQSLEASSTGVDLPPNGLTPDLGANPSEAGVDPNTLEVTDVTANRSVIDQMAEGIARAEGFYVAGSVPQRANNPGDLKLGDRGLGTIGGKTIFSSAAEGWTELRNQISIMFSGQSRYYNPGMSILDVAKIYTGNDNPTSWANTVAQVLGVDPGTALQDLA